MDSDGIAWANYVGHSLVEQMSFSIGSQTVMRSKACPKCGRWVNWPRDSVPCLAKCSGCVKLYIALQSSTQDK